MHTVHPEALCASAGMAPYLVTKGWAIAMSMNCISPMNMGMQGIYGSSGALGGIQQALQGLQQGLQGLQQVLQQLDNLLKNPMAGAMSAAGQGVAQALGGLGGGLGQALGAPLAEMSQAAGGGQAFGQMFGDFMQGLTQGITQGSGPFGGQQFFNNNQAAFSSGPSAPQGEGAPPAATASQAPTTSNVSADMGKAPAGMPAELWKNCVEAGQKTGVDPFVLAAQMEKESQFGKALSGSPSAGDGLMQVEPSTRQAYAGKFEAKMGHAYDHNDPKDQVAMAGVILADKGGDATNMLQKYNGGDNWTPGTTDSYGREIKANEYAASVVARAEQMKKSAA